jgi:hypothetical protein
MGLRIFNNFNAPLAVSIDEDDTSILLSTGYGALLETGGVWNVGDYTYGTLVNSNNDVEIIKITAGPPSDTLTVVRAQDNTTAKAWVTGDRLSLRPCAALMQDALEVNTDKLDATTEAVMALVPDATTLVRGAVYLATPQECLDGDDDTKAVTPAGLAAAAQTGVTVPDATTVVSGKTRYATNAEAITGTESSAAVTPVALAAALADFGGGGSVLGQVWESLTESRATNTVYQNTTGAPITVYVSGTALDESLLNPPPVLVYVGSGINPGYGMVSPVVVPAAWYYKSTVAIISTWYELR